jgi:predicted Fe-Mo cluster-binding NifX family protein
MRIAVASDDGRTIGSHFGRCQYFLVFDVREGAVTQVEARPNGQADPAGGDGGHHEHDHGEFARLLGDCDGVLAGGIGPRAVAALQDAGLAVATCPVDRTPAEAAAAFAARRLDRAPSGCSCGSGQH